MADAPHSILPEETQAIEVCRSAWPNHLAGEQAISPATGVICFRGPIDKESSTSFLEHLSQAPLEQPTYVIVHSGGGDVIEAIAMAKGVFDRQATVVVDGLCVSSCANYVFPAAKRKIVNEHSVLLYHGGITEANYERWSAEIVEDDTVTNKDEALASLRQNIDGDIAKQQALLSHIGVKADFFEWMQAAFDNDSVCSHFDNDYNAVVFSDALLATQGIEIDVNLGAKSQAEVDAIMQMKNLDKLTVCYLNGLD